MSVQLILLEDVADLGKIGDEVHVANGYAKLQKEHEERVAVAQAMADKIAQLTLTIPVAAGENDKLYGSVSAAQIADALNAQGIEVERNVVVLDEPIRELGSFDVDIKLHAEVSTKVKVMVTRADA